MLLYIGGYIVVAIGFYAYLALTAQNEPESQEWSNSSTGMSHAA